VWHNHEFGERRSTKDGVIGAVRVCGHKVDVVGAKVLCSAKLHGERDLPKGYRALSGENTLELCLVRFEISLA
jgi:hypothetical protein